MRTLSAKKLLAVGVLAFLAANSVYAATQIGTGTVDGQPSVSIDFDSGFATGTLSPVTVTATVAPTLDFSINSGSINLGTLSALNPSQATIQVAGSTNAFGGMKVSVSSSTGGLASPEHLIMYTGATLASGDEGYNVVVAPTTGFTAGNVTVATQNDTQVLAVNGPVANATANVTFNASISNVTPAGSYQVAHTFTVTGSF